MLGQAKCLLAGERSGLGSAGFRWALAPGRLPERELESGLKRWIQAPEP